MRRTVTIFALSMVALGVNSPVPAQGGDQRAVFASFMSWMPLFDVINNTDTAISISRTETTE